MKQMFIWILVLIAYSGAAFADEGSANINVMYGIKQLKTEDWTQDFDHQRELGLIFDYRFPDWPISIAFEGYVSAKKIIWDGVFTNIASTNELCIGLKKILEFESTSFRPFIAGGISQITGKTEDNEGSSQCSAFGYWVSGGLYYTFSDHFNVGLMARHSQASVTLNDKLSNIVDSEKEAGGTHYGAFIGVHW